MVWYCTVRYQLLFNHLHNLLAGIAIVELRKSYKEHGEELRHKVSKWKVYFTKITSLVWLTLSWWRQLSCRNQSIDLRSKSMDWFLYNNGLRHERVKENLKFAKYENFKYCNIFRELYICKCYFLMILKGEKFRSHSMQEFVEMKSFLLLIDFFDKFTLVI